MTLAYPPCNWRYSDKFQVEPNYQVRADSNPFLDGERGYYVYRNGRILPAVYSTDECEVHRRAFELFVSTASGEAGDDVPF